MESNIKFLYGPFAKPLEEQANSQGFTIGDETESLEECRNALITLNFGLDLPEAIHDKIRKMLHEEVVKNLKRI